MWPHPLSIYKDSADLNEFSDIIYISVKTGEESHQVESSHHEYVSKWRLQQLHNAKGTIVKRSRLLGAGIRCGEGGRDGVLKTTLVFNESEGF